jgi:hypothetical protein
MLLPATPKLDVKQLGKRFRAVLLVALLLICTINLLQLDTTPRVTIINSSQAYALHPVSTYQTTITNELRGSLLSSNKVTIDTKSLVADLKSRYPEIRDASVVLPLVGHRMNVYIELTQPILLLTTQSQSVIVDNSGHALVTASDVAKLSSFHLPVLVDKSQLQLKVGDTVLSSDAVSFVQTVLAQLAAKHVPINRLELPAGTEELDVYPKGKPYHVKFNLHQTDARLEVGSYLAVKSQLERQGTTPGSYIDVRLAGRAYYK